MQHPHFQSYVPWEESEIHIVFNLGYSLPNLTLTIYFGPKNHVICYHEFSIAFVHVL